MSAARIEEDAAHAATLDLLAAIAARNYQEVDQVGELRIVGIVVGAAIGRGNVTGHHAARIGSDRKAGFLESRNGQLMVRAGGRLGPMPPEGGQAARGQRASRACEKRGADYGPHRKASRHKFYAGTTGDASPLLESVYVQ